MGVNGSVGFEGNGQCRLRSDPLCCKVRPQGHCRLPPPERSVSATPSASDRKGPWPDPEPTFMGREVLTQTNDGKDTPAHWAAAGGNSEMLEYLFAKDPKLLAAKEKDGFTPAHHAAIRGHEKVISFFLEKYPMVLQIADDDGRNAIHMLASYGHFDIIVLVHSKKPDILLMKDDLQATVAHYAAAGGRDSILEFL